MSLGRELGGSIAPFVFRESPLLPPLEPSDLSCSQFAGNLTAAKKGTVPALHR